MLSFIGWENNNGYHGLQYIMWAHIMVQAISLTKITPVEQNEVWQTYTFTELLKFGFYRSTNVCSTKLLFQAIDNAWIVGSLYRILDSCVYACVTALLLQFSFKSYISMMFTTFLLFAAFAVSFQFEIEFILDRRYSQDFSYLCSQIQLLL